MKPCIEEEYISQLCTWVLVFSRDEKCSHGTYSQLHFFCEIELSFSALDLHTIGRNQMKPCIEEEYILQLCTWVLVFSCGEKCPHGTYSKIAIFRENRNQLFRARSPILLGGINETLHRGRIYIVVVHLGIGILARRKCPHGNYSKIAFFCEIELSFSALNLPYYWEESNETFTMGDLARNRKCTKMLTDGQTDPDPIVPRARATRQATNKPSSRAKTPTQLHASHSSFCHGGGGGGGGRDRGYADI